jgi:hypothetical protein
MNNRPFSVTLTSILIGVNALIWLSLGSIIVVNALPALLVPPALKWIMALLSIGMAAVLLGFFILLQKGNRAAYYLILAFFAVTSLLTIFDDVGLSDIVVLILNIIPIILLIKDRTWYLQKKPEIDHNV